MKIGLNQGTTLENSSLEKDLELCEKYGYDYIEIRSIDQLKDYLKTHSLEDLAAYFQTHHIKPLSLNALVFFNNRTEEEYAALREEFQEMLEIAKVIDCKNIVVVPLVSEQKILRKDIIKSSVETLRDLSDLADPYGVKLAIEFIGHPHATINTLEFANHVVNEVDRHNVGIVFDTFQYYAMNSTLESLENTDSAKIFIFHINDVEDYQPGILMDVDRVYPGHGAIDLDSILAILKDKGVDHVSVELFRPEYYQLDAEEVIKTAKETTMQVISKHFEVEKAL